MTNECAVKVVRREPVDGAFPSEVTGGPGKDVLSVGLTRQLWKQEDRQNERCQLKRTGSLVGHVDRAASASALPWLDTNARASRFDVSF